ncbi:hypothetical protein DFP72DRAFT_1077487 [Ephemerocybe angulata]|uniref:Uncharacterized protein n=1 Tax=Ephemerocybe angulata TaxID=980116 RepID=A0A8H6LY86_9AGAR|nr:hypothetical protein DFP72DRAFT_1077487 [Tulosesus angulatus]
MQFTFVSLAMVLGAALQTTAQSLSVVSSSFSGNGCPQGSGTTISVTSGSISYTPPSTFTAAVGPGVPASANLEACRIAISANIPSGFRFRFAQTNVPVTTSTGSGNSEQVTDTYFFSSAAGTTATVTTTLTSTGSTTVSNVYSPATVWSPCGGSDIININTQLRAIGSSAGSITSAGTIVTPITWQAC